MTSGSPRLPRRCAPGTSARPANSRSGRTSSAARVRISVSAGSSPECSANQVSRSSTSKRSRSFVGIPVEVARILHLGHSGDRHPGVQLDLVGGGQARRALREWLRRGEHRQVVSRVDPAHLGPASAHHPAAAGSNTTCGSNSASRDHVRWRTGRTADTTWRSGHHIRAS